MRREIFILLYIPYKSFDLNFVLDEEAFYGKIGRILNQLDVAQINNEIETESRKIENESENYFGSWLQEESK